VLEYEIERQLPFRRDDIYFDFMRLGSRATRIGDIFSRFRKKVWSIVLDVLGSFGIRPNGVETTVTAMANYLLFLSGRFK